ncbi:MAG: hypothetical protein WC829_13215 [Hyphomicrobium sp.]|jgi:hypothetical protein
MRTLCLIVVACVAQASLCLAGNLPKALHIGYEGEGAVDASTAACTATVKDLVEWEDDQMRAAVKTVCSARQAHIDAYADLQKSYKHFASVFGEDTRIETADAVQQFQHMIKACIDHKSDLTPGGHNIAIDIIPNGIATNCLQWGKRMLDDETAWYEAPPESHTRASP